jgi:rare lipoprotein A
MKKRTHNWPKGSLLLVLVFFAWGLRAQDRNYSETGLASFYADKFEGRKTANGEIYYHLRKTAAHPHLPFGSVVKVTHLENGKFVVVRINDRGPFVEDRIIDLSRSAAAELGFIGQGLARVKVELIASTDELPGDPTEKPEAREYFRIKTTKATPSGLGIQVASFSAHENLLRMTERIHSGYHQPVFIEIAESGGQKVFRVIVGNFSSQDEALKLKKTLAREFPDCYVVSFAK